jgi:diketogulonate reductase-like aldo/keto reductase
MFLRKIPSSGEEIPVIGMGSWLTFEKKQTPDKNPLIIFSQHGGKLIDTSPMYGIAEKAIGDLSADIHDLLFYATKVWTTGKEAGIKMMQSSMQKLHCNVIDLMQIHNLVDWKIHLSTLRQWKEEGKIRYIGITHYTVAAHTQLEQIIKAEKIDFVQFNYSIATRNAEKSLLTTAADYGVAAIINEPLEKGNLFLKVKGTSLPQWAIDEDIKTWTAFFLKYIISHPAVTCIIPATSNAKHLIENVESGNGNMPDEKLRKKMVDFFQRL